MNFKFSKKLNIILICLGMFGCYTKPPHISNYYPTKIKFRNGLVINGLTKGPIELGGVIIDDNKNKTKFLYNEVETATKEFPERIAEYVTLDCVTTTNAKKPYQILAVKEIEGQLSLYSHEFITYLNTSNSNYSRPIYKISYYFKKKNEPAFEILNFSWYYYNTPRNKKFIEFAKNYFNDQPKLANKIGQVGYELKDIKKIVEEYNQQSQ